MNRMRRAVQILSQMTGDKEPTDDQIDAAARAAKLAGYQKIILKKLCRSRPKA
jgi:hypothetical protein